MLGCPYPGRSKMGNFKKERKMSKKSNDNCRPGGIEIQKGTVSMDEQYNSKFRREPEMTNQDIKDNEGRQSGKRLTLHTPKR